VTAPDRLSSAKIITVYGVDACEDTARARRHLEAAGVPFAYVDLDRDIEARQRLHEPSGVSWRP
jgi:glutaredoxin